jgi:ankyrin repeat protein
MRGSLFGMDPDKSFRHFIGREIKALIIFLRNSDLDGIPLRELFIRKQLSPNARLSVGQTPLMLAAQNQNHDMILFLLDKHADPNLQDDNGKTALMYAIKPDDFILRMDHSHKAEADSVRILVSASANLDIQDCNGNTALMLALDSNSMFHVSTSPEFISMFLSFNHDTTLKNNAGHTALMIAAQRGNLNAIPLLMQRTRDLLKHRKTVLYDAWSTAPLEIGDMIHQFAYNDNFVDEPDNTGQTALMLAICQLNSADYGDGDYIGIIQILLPVGDATIKDDDGHTAHYYAEQMPESQFKEIILALLPA